MTYEDLRAANEALATMDIKGKAYVLVNARVTAFRKLFPEGTITTKIIDCSDGVVTMQARVMDAAGKVLATGLAYEKETSSYINKTSYIENCETSAVGRALGFLGIGVDTSIASYEEVRNAVENQEPKKTERYKGQEKLTDDEVGNLLDELKKAGVRPGTVLAQYGAKRVADLTPSQYIEILGTLG